MDSADQMRVHWVGIDKDVTSFIGSCHRCQFAKSAPHGPQAHGSLNPSMAPYPHHTWCIDLKGESQEAAISSFSPTDSAA